MQINGREVLVKATQAGKDSPVVIFTIYRDGKAEMYSSDYKTADNALRVTKINPEVLTMSGNALLKGDNAQMFFLPQLEALEKRVREDSDTGRRDKNGESRGRCDLRSA
jgi:hemin uptake protein HemP